MQQVESPGLVNPGVEGHWPDAATCSDQGYSPMCRGDLAPETAGQPFIEYEGPSGSVGQRLAVKEEPSTDVSWQVENKPKKSSQAINTATKPRRRGSAVDDKHKVTKKNFAPAQTPRTLCRSIQSFPDQHQPPSPSVGAPPRSSLRTATRKSCPPINASPKPGESAEDHHLRTTHNLVEQKYRARVQTGFEGLIEVLPGESGDEGVGSRRPPRRMSKADVLARSTYVVKTLMDENKELKRKLDEMKASFVAEIKRKER
ncbi:hypothetical protein QBC42DRAFT_281494 [Cladorrhinum samala]|uniref:BHLH domain-containing protein n=1 Tax=Cladorrhinum samala TaxID=585594 RepID=A0AAV9HBA8_9PEZI|nr:hypothetical protein QBC42DRAFT_281494 [Cladorrhinum samala]